MARPFTCFLFALLAAALFLVSAKPAHPRTPSRRAVEKAFLEENATKPGIISTGSGLQYEVLREGSGSHFPKWRDTVSIHLKGTLLDGTVFESTLHRDQPISTKLSKLIEGCEEAIKLMNVGDRYRFYIPSKLGYGSARQGDIPPYSVLIFEIELFEIVGKQ
ncbi:FKBP-type peptidyl-prolyl cis-trans isomerase [Pelagicoccus sp. SDUM812002]|uniref:FKBP-type peptidyl-prolyl cis-trans isomerase n=1 Tax=Pelagicoccus sp. SDUM812002 TaxID=3041266 RepID=UPI00280DCDA3|nr:FKBP-type peptidyl-prolyl cis-trans isomerase [Pelagicoccus sp. SDUM812002]MDQ8186994.1 FKBP-type peptidyl-prolyl cis-trans isomerase [Pelagicoccus sp. SDUM812002]